MPANQQKIVVKTAVSAAQQELIDQRRNLKAKQNSLRQLYRVPRTALQQLEIDDLNIPIFESNSAIAFYAAVQLDIIQRSKEAQDLLVDIENVNAGIQKAIEKVARINGAVKNVVKFVDTLSAAARAVKAWAPLLP